MIYGSLRYLGPLTMYMKIDDMGLSIRKFEVCTSNSNQDGGLGQILK